MSSSLHHTQFLLHLPSLHISLGNVLRTNMKVSCKQIFRLQAINWKPSPCKGMVRRFFSVNQENGFHFHFSEQSAENDVDEARDEEHKTRNSWTNDTNVECSLGNGDGNGNGNDKGNKASFEGGGGDEGKECNNQDEFIGIEWWWWWKWHQACRGSQNGATQSPLWPVDAAVQVVANEVMESIEPAVQAIVIEPIRQQLNIKGLIVVLVLGVLVISTIQMVAGLAVMSMGVSLAGVASIVLATLIWWPWKKNGGQRHHNGES